MHGLGGSTDDKRRKVDTPYKPPIVIAKLAMQNSHFKTGIWFFDSSLLTAN
jgi:hypothetical protein